jgi:hypothetical protein
MADENSGGQPAVENDFVIHGEAEPTLETPPVEEPKGEEKPKDEAEESDDSGKGKKSGGGGFKRKLAKQDAEIAKLRAELEAERKGRSETKEPEVTEKEPDPYDYKTDEEYTRALAKYEGQKAARDTWQKLSDEEKSKANEEKFRTELKTKLDRYTEGVTKMQEAHGDYDDVIDNYDGPFTEAMRMALLESESGPEVAYHLAKNPEEAEKISKMGIVDLNRAIAKLEVKLEIQKGEKPGDNKGQKGNLEEKAAVTKSPPPITPLKGSATSTKDPSDMSYDEFREHELRRLGNR